jgi:hypothetical protein
LIDLIGEEAYNQYFGAEGELNGYLLNGIQLNGVEATNQDLEVIIGKVKEGNSDIIEVTVE